MREDEAAAGAAAGRSLTSHLCQMSAARIFLSLSSPVRSPLTRRDILLLSTPSALCSGSVVWRAGGCCHRWRMLQLQHPPSVEAGNKRRWLTVLLQQHVVAKSPSIHSFSSSAPPLPADARLGKAGGGFSYFINHPPLPLPPLQWVHPRHQHLSLWGTETIQASFPGKYKTTRGVGWQRLHPPSHPL